MGLNAEHGSTTGKAVRATRNAANSKHAEALARLGLTARGGIYIDSAIAADVLAVPALGMAVGRGRGATPRLSPRETETLRLVARGYSNKEIAAQLDVSVKTIETHKANGMHKLGMLNRIDIVRYAMLQGWLDEP